MKKFLITLVVVLALLLLAAYLYAVTGNATTRISQGDAGGPDRALAERGRYLATAGDCVACHTAPGGQPFAGGLAIDSPLGTLYSSNITPDKDTGIGGYSLDDFDRALRHGIRADGKTLYPAMPYPAYARISDDDVRALYAYFMTSVKPQSRRNQATGIPWPMSMRWPVAIWRKLFTPSQHRLDAAAAKWDQDPRLARGAYLVEGLGHCGSCHTPRGLAFQEQALSAADGDRFLAGGPALDGFVATSLRSDADDGLGRWSQDELARFLKTGRNAKTAAFGSMTDVVEHSLQYLSDADITAMAMYLKAFSGTPAAAPAAAAPQAAAKTTQALHDLQIQGMPGARVYVDNCMACHRSDGQGYAEVFPGLVGNSVLNAQDPTSVIHIILRGWASPATAGAITPFTMPGFGQRLSDQQVADVATFIRAGWGNQGGKVSAADVAKVRASLPAAKPQPETPGEVLGR